MSHSCVWHNSRICITGLHASWVWDRVLRWHVWHVTKCLMSGESSWAGPPSYRRAEYDSCRCVWHESFMRVTWLLHMCNMTLSHVWHVSKIRVSQLICITWLHAARPLQRMPYSLCAWHDSFMRVPRLTHICAMTYSCVMYDTSHSKFCTLRIYQIEKLKFLGTNSNLAKITIWICIARYQGIWVSRFLWISGVKHFQWNLSYKTRLRCMIWLRTCLTTRTVTQRCVASM